MKKLVLVLFFGAALVLAGCHDGYYRGRISYSHHDHVNAHGYSRYGGYSYHPYGHGYQRGHHGRAHGPRHQGQNHHKPHSRQGVGETNRH